MFVMVYYYDQCDLDDDDNDDDDVQLICDPGYSNRLKKPKK